MELQAWLRCHPSLSHSLTPLPLQFVTRYCVLATRLSVTRYRYPFALCRTARATCPGHASLLGLTTTVCLALPPSLSPSLLFLILLLLCVFLSISALLLLLLCCPPLTGTYNCLIVNVVVVILENIFLKIFLHIQFLFSFVIHKNSRAEQAPHDDDDDDDTKRCTAGVKGNGAWGAVLVEAWQSR